MIEAEKAEKLAEYYNTNSAYDKAAEFYEEAANWGSVNAKYQFATFLQQGKGLSTPYPNSAKEQFRQAAALGCPKSQHALAQFSN
jgi:TPR repeat protein